MRTQEELAALHREAEAEFKKYPGVVAVAYGFKLKGGETTQRLAFRIYVEEKKSEAELSPDEIIPPEFRGVLTDVVEISRGRMFAGCRQTDLDGPLVSGITITNLLQDAKGIHIGTLGFFATINGKSGPDNVVYVSNNHVLMAASAHEGDPVSRPKINASNQIVKDQSSQKGVIHKQGKQDNVKYPDATTGQDFWVDAATAKIDVCLSSWCHTNCGTEFKNEVRGLHIDADPANHVVADTKKSIAAVKTLQLSD